MLSFAMIVMLSFFTHAQTDAEARAGVPSDTLSEYKIAVSSDLHIDPENIYGGVVNPLVVYNMELIDALRSD